MTAWLDNFEGVPHADRDGSESLRVLDSPGLSDGVGTSGTPCPTKAVLSEVDTRLKSSIDRLESPDRARIAFLESELAASHKMVAHLSALLGQRDAELATHALLGPA